MFLTSQTPVYITKSISPIHANAHRRNLRPWFVILSSALSSVGRRPAIQSQGGIQPGFNFNKQHHPETDM